MPSNFYDVVIVGGDLTGIIAGALAAKKGKRVLVLENQENQDVAVVDSGIFPLKPLLLYGIESSSIIKKVLNELDIFIEVRNKVFKFKPFFQIISKDFRIDITDNERDLNLELSREFGKQVANAELAWMEKIVEVDSEFSRFLEQFPHVPAESFWEKREYNKLLAEYENSVLEVYNTSFKPVVSGSLLLKFFKRFVPFFFDFDFIDLPPLNFLKFLRHLLEGTYYLGEEIYSFKELFLNVIKRKSGTVDLKNSVKYFHVKRSKVQEIVLKGVSETIGGEIVLCNMEPKRFFSFIPPENQKEKFHHHLKTIEISKHRYNLVFQLKSDIFLEGAGNLLFFDEQISRYPLILYIPKSHEFHRNGLTVLASAIIPDREFRLTPEYLDKLDNEIINSISTINPFFRELIIRKKRVNIDEMGVLIQNRFHPVYLFEHERGLDLNMFHYETPYKNIFFASDYFYGTLGIEGPFVGAKVIEKKGFS